MGEDEKEWVFVSQWCFTKPPQWSPSGEVTDPFLSLPSEIKFSQAGDLWREGKAPYWSADV